MEKVIGKVLTFTWQQKACQIGWVYLLLIAPASFLLPEWFGWENGPIEMTQNFVLFGGILLSLYFYRHRAGRWERFWLPVAAYFTVLLGRELSWGRVFFMTHMTEHGPSFISMSDIPYHSIIHGAIAVFMGVTLISLIVTMPWRSIFRAAFPKSAFLLLLICVGISSFGDKDLITGAYWDETMEEFAELLLYFVNIYFAVWYRRALRELKP